MKALTRGLLFAACTVLFAGLASAESLTTTYAGGNGQEGTMFDIQAINTVTVTAFDQNVSSNPGDPATIYVYTKTGTHMGFENNSGAWTLIATVAVTSAGTGNPTHVTLPVPVVVPAGATQAFYLSNPGDAGVEYTDGTAQGSVFVQDANIRITEGAGVEYPFGTIYVPRVWNGTVYYTVGGAAAAGGVDVPLFGPAGTMVLLASLAGAALLVMRRVA